MSNDIVIEAWNTVLFEKFSRFKYLFIEGYAAISEEALKRHRFPKGSRVLDVGCGFGDCTIAIAKTLGKTWTCHRRRLCDKFCCRVQSNCRRGRSRECQFYRGRCRVR